jgi:hypothetical protein
MRGAIVDILLPFRADPHALGTTLFEGREDDMGTKEEVKPNFRTPPRRGKLIVDWHARMTYDM